MAHCQLHHGWSMAGATLVIDQQKNYAIEEANEAHSLHFQVHGKLTSKWVEIHLHA